ncbi:MAG: DUF4177 domain-containing protein [Gemmobacter sp.]|nr:DUF4177 domain-containing protein [Gemmobacter sp.]
MQQYEYKVVPAPKRGAKHRGLKTTQDRFAFALTELMNDMARDGWEYLRADALPCEEKVGLTGRSTSFHNLLVFRRGLAAVAARPVVAPAAPTEAVKPEPGALPPLRLGPAVAEQGPAPVVGAAKPGVAAQ